MPESKELETPAGIANAICRCRISNEPTVGSTKIIESCHFLPSKLGNQFNDTPSRNWRYSWLLQVAQISTRIYQAYVKTMF